MSYKLRIVQQHRLNYAMKLDDVHFIPKKVDS